jgi:hypothetical protein
MLAAVALVESELGADVAWTLGAITSDHHSLPPFGRGLSVNLIGPGTEKQPKPIQVFEKHAESFLVAARRAISRYKRRALGEGWA